MNGPPRRPGPGAPAPAPPPGAAPAPRSVGLATKIGLLFALLIMGKVASMAKRGPVGTEELRLLGIVLGEILLLIVALVNVNFVFYVLVFYVPFSQMLPGDYGTAVNITNVLLVIIVFGLFFRSIREGGHFLVSTELDRLIGLHLLLTFVAFFRAALAETMDWFLLVTLIKRFITPIFLYYLASWIVRDRQQIQDCIYIVMLTTLMVAFLATKDTHTPTHFSWERREDAGLSQANLLAAFFVYYMFYYFAFFSLHANQFKYWLLLICIYPCARGIMLAFSRGGYFAFVAGTLYICWLYKKWLFVLTAVVMLMLWQKPGLVLPQAVVERIEGTTVEYEADYGKSKVRFESSSAGRIAIYTAGLKMVMRYPLLGVGYGQFPVRVGEYDSYAAGRDAHNAYLLIAAEMGIPALLVYLMIVFRLLRYSLAIYRYGTDTMYRAVGMGFATGVIGFLVANFFGCRFNTTETVGVWWILAAMIVLIRKQSMMTPGAVPPPPVAVRPAGGTP
ncbi:MAG: O-antigen ligase family protein [Chlamydiae bacterium]|nr:O-antigen ligase family protein [Chlamydiota bacterium]